MAEAEIKGQRDNGLGVSLRRAGKAELPNRSILQSPPRPAHPQQARIPPTSLGYLQCAQTSISGPARQIAAGGTTNAPYVGEATRSRGGQPIYPDLPDRAGSEMMAAGSAHASLTVRLGATNSQQATLRHQQRLLRKY